MKTGFFRWLIVLLTLGYTVNAQVLPPDRSVNWRIAGLKDTTSLGFQVIDMGAAGLTGDGLTPNDSAFAAVLAVVGNSGAILHFPPGNYLFQHPLQIGSNTLLRGEGPESTTISLDLGGAGHGILFQGNLAVPDTSSLAEAGRRDSSFVRVSNPLVFSAGDWVRIVHNDSSLVTSAWAMHSTGQIVQIQAVQGDTLFLASPLRMNYSLLNHPFLSGIEPVYNSGIQCLRIHRMDNSAPNQTSNIFFGYAVNCHVQGIESEMTNFAHVEAEFSSNLSIRSSYFHHSHEYGENGRGYGVILHFGSGECRVEDNIFNHLRHSMIVQAGANGNVFAYNASFDAYWTTFPNNASGDLVLHGNYPYSNLFEQNIVQNAVIDNSHGPNGPFNTLFRNRTLLYGIFFSAANSPDQNLIGNEIPNTSFPYSLVNYTILGNGHFLYGNNNKGNLVPAGTNALSDTSYAYTQRPDWLPASQWGGIGTPSAMGSSMIPASDRYSAGNLFYHSCGVGAVGISLLNPQTPELSLYPNPVAGMLTVLCTENIHYYELYQACGKRVMTGHPESAGFTADVSSFPAGMYYLVVYGNHAPAVFRKILIH